MFKKVTVFLIILGFFTLGSQTVLGRNVLSMPSADLYRMGQASLEYSYHPDQSWLVLSAGLTSRLNLGIRAELSGSGDLLGLFRLGVLEEGVLWPGIALGAELGRGGQHFYGVVSKQLGRPDLRAHLALGTGRYARGMGGISLVLNPVRIRSKGLILPTTSAILEYDGTGLNLGLTAQFSAGLRGHIALVDFSRLGCGLNLVISF